MPRMPLPWQIGLSDQLAALPCLLKLKPGLFDRAP